MFQDENWHVIEDFPHYFVSNYGRVKHEDRVDARRVAVNDRGFPIIILYGSDGKSRYLRQINKLVAVAFLPTPLYEDHNAVWHIDGDLTNCRADNLRWAQRSHVLEWNEMHRTKEPKYKTPKVMNNRTGDTYANAFECGMAEGELESKILWRIERQARHIEDETARYRYVFGGR